jgi:hypothetical protein
VVVRAFEPFSRGWCCWLSRSSFKDPGRAGFFARETETSFRSGNFLITFGTFPI